MRTTWARRLAWGSLGLGVVLLAGCAQTPSMTTAAPKQDPLFGVTHPPSLPNHSPSPSAQSTTPAPQAYNGGVPPIPTALSASNTAQLAGTSWQSPQAALAINDNQAPLRRVPPGQLTNDKKLQQTPVMPGFPGPNPNPRVEQVPDATPLGQGLMPTINWQSANNASVPTIPSAVQTTSAATSALAAEQLFRQLQERGVTNQKQDAVPEGVHLTCYVARGPGLGMRIYEVTAVDYASAAQLILEQLPPAAR